MALHVAGRTAPHRSRGRATPTSVPQRSIAPANIEAGGRLIEGDAALWVEGASGCTVGPLAVCRSNFKTPLMGRTCILGPPRSKVVKSIQLEHRLPSPPIKKKSELTPCHQSTWDRGTDRRPPVYDIVREGTGTRVLLCGTCGYPTPYTSSCSNLGGGGRGGGPLVSS